MNEKDNIYNKKGNKKVMETCNMFQNKVCLSFYQKSLDEEYNIIKLGFIPKTIEDR